MMEGAINLYKVAAFTDQIPGGNPAGVVFDADALTESDMLRIAKKVGYSETAFVMKSTVADNKVRFFTPVDEVDLCGHATIGTFNLMRDLGLIGTGSYTQETKAGILKLQIQENHVFMEQKLPQYFETIDRNEIKGCFNCPIENYISESPIQIVSTGIRDIILPVRNLELLFSLVPDLDLIEAISKKYDVVGIHAFCLETLKGHDIHARNFAPRYGIAEESATGTSNGALACYLSKYHRGFSDSINVEQGFCMDRPSVIRVRLRVNEGQVSEVYVGGSAVRITIAM